MKFILKITIFSIIFVMLLFGVSQIARPKNNTQECGMNNVKASGILGEKRNSIDVLVIGDSEAFSAISPLQIFEDSGIPVYTSASGRQLLYRSIDYLEMALEKQKIKMIILETNNIFSNYSYFKYAADRIGNIFPIIKYNTFWKTENIKYIGKAAEYTWTDDFKGFHVLKHIDPSPDKDYMKPSDGEQKINKLNKEHILYINQLAKENGAKLVFLSTPSTLNWNMEKHNSVVKLAKEMEVDYIDLNLIDIGIDWDKDTYDKGDHVNYTGAKKVTSYLTQYLKDTNQFEDQRDNVKYRKWKKALKRYHAEIQ
ncbi:MAG: hypothetical protein WBO70_03795 [Erysipelotrichaceae bacterium]